MSTSIETVFELFTLTDNRAARRSCARRAVAAKRAAPRFEVNGWSPDVSQRLRHLQDRHRPVELAHGRADGGGAPLRRGRAAPARRQARGGSTVGLHGSLAFTGKGHGTDRAIALALAGEAPDTVDPDRVPAILPLSAAAKSLAAIGLPDVAFDPAADIVFDYGPPLPGHANGMIFRALDASGGGPCRATSSIRSAAASCARRGACGGGRRGHAVAEAANPPVPYPFATRVGDAGDGRGLRPFDRRR